MRYGMEGGLRWDIITASECKRKRTPGYKYKRHQERDGKQEYNVQTALRPNASAAYPGLEVSSR